MSKSKEIVYLAGAITSNPQYQYDFSDAEMVFSHLGNVVLNPACLPLGLRKWEDYMEISQSMLEVADTCVFLQGWKRSKGAKREHELAEKLGKKIVYYNRSELVV